MRRLVAGTCATTLATAVALVQAAPASAHGDGCSYRTSRATVSVVDGWYDQVDIDQSTVWSNCNTHTHPREATIKFTFRSADDERDWKNDPDDYITYSCKVLTNNGVVDSWSGKLNYGDRVDGHTISDQSKMYYKNNPRTVCTGKVHEDWAGDWTWKSVGKAI